MSALKLGLTLLLLFVNFARAQGPMPESDPRGAVFCIWGIYLSIRKMGDICFPSEDQDFKQVLDEAIQKMEKFIVENSPTTFSDLEQSRPKMVETLTKRSRADVCDETRRNDGILMYRKMKSDIEKIPTSIVQLLAVPRKPVWNPCL